MPKPKNDLLATEAEALHDIGQELVFSAGGEKELFFDEKGELTSTRFQEKELTGDEAMKYLLGITRPNQQLRLGDHATIEKRFRPLSTSQNKDKAFWGKIKIRVWKVDNVGEYTASISLKDKDGNLDTHEGARYTGDVFDGTALEGFVPNVALSPRHNEFRVQLLSVKVSEEMTRVR